MSKQRFSVGQRFRSNLFGTIYTIVDDFYYDDDYVELVPEVANHRYYMVEVNGTVEPMEHTVIANTCTPLTKEPEDGSIES